MVESKMVSVWKTLESLRKKALLRSGALLLKIATKSFGQDRKLSKASAIRSGNIMLKAKQLFQISHRISANNLMCLDPSETLSN